jgi:teichoic acid transport system permease protein
MSSATPAAAEGESGGRDPLVIDGLDDQTMEAAGLFRLNAVPSDEEYLEDIWDRRAFLWALPAEEIRSRHQNTLLGNLWHLANPLLSAAVYYVIFGLLLNTGGGTDNLLAYLTIGVFTFNLTQRTVISGARSITGNMGLIRSMRFPRAMLPISTVISHAMTFGSEMVVLALVCVATGEGVSPRWIALPAVLALHSMLNLGLVFYIARFNEAYRDIENIVPFIFRLLIYVSGAMFPVERYSSKFPSSVQVLIRYNPIARIMDLYRWALMDYPIDARGTAVALLISALLLVAGFRYFKAAENEYGRS